MSNEGIDEEKAEPLAVPPFLVYSAKSFNIRFSFGKWPVSFFE
ncbi:hypothetical protein SAMN02745165_00678 [Malonomonas rubra DSM 5091]|uniref:Uncharacterized protein n=1 Tax=Malonomonas rubra DSM 5091 TaxID=1122189 RepID=A0A1M6DGX3_MALRU|nr:hypothetical protein SAMN02745165_00678 [Malonomonas rubra DSM 5091]